MEMTINEEIRKEWMINTLVTSLILIKVLVYLVSGTVDNLKMLHEGGGMAESEAGREMRDNWAAPVGV